MPDENSEQTLTKHEQILRHIESLRVGSHISVRQIAKDLDVSEGTAYRAIKEAENKGIVSTKERIGTVRIEKKQKNIDKLTFFEVAHIVNGEVLGGARGLNKSLNKFVIGAMEQAAMLRYIDAGSLLIVGNREEAHKGALQNGAAVLITGGFDTSLEVKRLADSLALPIISSSFDTFTVASMINRALYDRMIKKKIMLVEDVITRSRIYALKASSTVADWRKLSETAGYDRFPVVDEWNRVIGMVTAKDVEGAANEQQMEKLMTRNPVTINLRTSVASAAHLMMWEGIDLLPVVDNGRKLLGTVSRTEVMGVLQYIQRQPQMGETFDDQMWEPFTEIAGEDRVVYRGQMSPQMTSQLGTVSSGVLTTLITQAAYRVAERSKKGDLVIDNISTYFLHPVQMESEIVIKPEILEVSRKFAKIEVDVISEDRLVAKALVTAHVFDDL
ncbi:DRTGG domain-containing protein [Gorillibacterium timonense]|uniref:DRTGG domain-containing protein n=1 Tax=Gorillibacterium timonense TaxID=1689269 RepID=UPI00071D54DB|nr:DRTGG domain-containing protein [Gorillibacterium timonense]